MHCSTQCWLVFNSGANFYPGVSIPQTHSGNC